MIHNGVELADNRLQEQHEKNSLVIGIVGQLIPRKGHIDAIEALKILSGQGIDSVVLKIIGDGDKEYKKQLETLAERYGLDKQIQFLGFQKTSNEIYGGLDLVITPTRNDEPFALVPLEANAMGRPVIVTDKGGFPEMIKDGYNGFIVENSNPQQLAEKMALFVHDRSLQAEMGANGRSHIENFFTKEMMIKKVKNLIDSI